MPARKEYTPEFKDQAVRFVLEEIEPDESRKHACDRLAPRLSVKAVTLYNWLKLSAPAKPRASAPPGSVEELRAQAQSLKKENCELTRANAMADSDPHLSVRSFLDLRDHSVRGVAQSRAHACRVTDGG